VGVGVRAQAGIVCSLSARTSVIAAANPVGGHYNRYASFGFHGSGELEKKNNCATASYLYLCHCHTCVSMMNRTCVICRAKTVNENLKISAALLSRFDLIFILLDKPNEERDNMLSEHVIAVRHVTSIQFVG
jgi:DNA helicase MCM8